MTTTKTVSRSFLPLLLIFIIANAFFINNKSLTNRWNVDATVMLVGNGLLFGATSISFYLYVRSLRTKNAQAIIRSMYASILAKMMICLVAAFIYISITGKEANKGGIFGCMFLYLVYTFTEVAILMKMSKQNKNV